ncbi:MAG: hypothetical protein LJE56_08665 [Acidiferrobacterales bacterium]|nr:hypothetical protein [Acidiferrobacterales bacterium]
MVYLYRLLVIVLFGIAATACSGTPEYASYANPAARHVMLHGTMDDKFDYNFGVVYSTRTKTKRCMKFTYPVGWGPAYKRFEYFPPISDGKYRATIPLLELDPETVCQWKPDFAQVCAYSKAKPQPNNYFTCSILFYDYNKRRDGGLEIGAPLHFYCDPESYQCFTGTNWRETVFRIKQFYIKVYNRDYMINISALEPS